MYDRLRADILSGALQPDQRLRLAELAAKFGISQMPVREALRMLQRDGLILMEDHRGATVANVSWRRAFEFVDVRTYLEVYAAVQALPYHTDNTITHMRDLLNRMNDPGALRDAAYYSKLNREFHTILYDPCPNTVLKQQIEELWNKVWNVRRLSIFSVDRERSQGAQVEHQAIVEAIQFRDRGMLEEAMHRHRNQTLSTWMKIVEESESNVA
ncbi:GntR family transcriptional regulator [Aminobacter sp. J44]|uniref:GntR family transcriptional regulator n=1 Tax=Aminobacter sp. J44 TaxID=935262 RepID=UPI001645B1AE|nr:GntR family transcriptional regulator [Aminobacter sp. J44]